MQMLADLQVMAEHRAGGLNLQGATLAFVGDTQNNVTYDLMRAGTIMGLQVRVSGPAGPDYAPEPAVLDECAALAAVAGAGSAKVCATAEEAVRGADFVYADSWLSYGISGSAREQRLGALMPWQVGLSNYILLLFLLFPPRRLTVQTLHLAHACFIGK